MKLTFQEKVILGMCLVLLALSYKLIDESRDYDCEKCIIELKSKMFLADHYFTNEVSLIDIVNDLNNKECSYQWQKNQGWTNG